MTTSDIDQALRVLNIEPLYGHSPHHLPTFRRALPFPNLTAAGPVYFVEDEEIDFDRVLREEKITLPNGVSWTAHWLAVEGVQTADTRESTRYSQRAGAWRLLNRLSEPIPPFHLRLLFPKSTHDKKAAAAACSNKSWLSRELQLYYNRLTSSLLPPSSSELAKRTAALASLRHDAGLQALLPYLIRWIGRRGVGLIP